MYTPIPSGVAGPAPALTAIGDKPTPAQVREVAGQFEALFTQMMLKSMRSASLGEGLLDSRNTEMYHEMFDQQIALQLSSGRGLGLKDMLMRQLGVEPEAAPVERAMQPLRGDGGLPPLRGAAGSWQPPASAQEFVDSLWPHAKETARKLGVNAKALLAQAALETGWGQRMPTRENGDPSLNLFGIKAGSEWQGERVAVSTVEYVAGAEKRERASFRAYDSIADSFADYANLIGGNPRYAEALRGGAVVSEFAHGLQDAGYATDPQYARKIRELADGDTMRAAIGRRIP